MHKTIATALLLMALPFVAFATDNAELRALKQADQTDRSDPMLSDKWPDVLQRDAQRRKRVLEILQAGGLTTAWDYYNAALVMQHGRSSDDIRLAHSLSTIAATLDPKHPSAKWLMAASWDRLMLRFKQPQWYGTQSIQDDSGKFVLYTVHPDAVTDADRVALGVPTLAQAQAEADRANTDK
ncbi:hypothetical protein ACFFGH_00365 [Lysobacter korlensis]|uniref:Secreted protein n=1 Tax=Lysobacter korlensis TaxID=553636 RepID=A0ABV6RH51_9GAMM